MYHGVTVPPWFIYSYIGLAAPIENELSFYQLMKPLDINIVYNEIIEKLKASNYAHIIMELEKSDAGAVTSSEALMNQASYLLSLRQNNPSAFNLIESQIENYLKYCRQYGLIIR